MPNHYFLRNQKPNEKITLVEDNKIISEDKDYEELLKSFFSNTVKNLKIPELSDSIPLAENIPHTIFKVVRKYKNHPSITAIKNARNGPGFYFCGVSVNDAFKAIKRLRAREATQITDIPVKVLKENADIMSVYICDFLNETRRSGKFPAILKNEDTTAVFKKVLRDLRKTIVSILPIISKIFEKIISITNFIDPLLSKY